MILKFLLCIVKTLALFNYSNVQAQFDYHLFLKKVQFMNQQPSHLKLKNIVQVSSLAWPNESKFRDQLSLPLSLALRPLQLLEDKSLTASFSNKIVNNYRCQSCKAFINHYCVIISKNQYNCSICGCTNKTQQQINPLAGQFTSPIYTFGTNNPSFRSNHTKVRTFVFAIDLSQYLEQTKTVVHYVSDIIKDFLKQVQKQHENTKKQKSKIQIIILGFTDHIQQYRIISCSQSKVNITTDTIHEQNQGDAFSQNQNDNHNENQNQQQVQIDKIIDTHLEMNYQDLMSEKDKVFIQLPKYSKQVEEILADLVSSVQNSKQKSTSNALLAVIQKILNYTNDCAGKIYIITGLRNSKCPFVTNIYQQPQQFRSNFSINRKKCLSQSLQFQLSKTNMSVSIFVYNNTFINLMPLYAITKSTNGELKHYNPHNYHQFYYELYYSVCTQSFQMMTQTVIKIRTSPGIKLIGTFGQYRTNKNVQDQFQLLSCSPNRLYLFQFMIQGKINQAYINVQFSILYTDQFGNRNFKVITHSQRVTDNYNLVLDSINYGIVNQSYLWAVLHNMDFNIKIKNLQLTLQQRCRKHLQALQKYREGKSQSIKKSTPYIIFTYYLISHFILNTKFDSDRIYDKSIEARSRIITGDTSSIYAVWPVVYSINSTKIKVVELRYQQIKESQVAVVIDQGDFCYLYIVSEHLKTYIIKKKMQQNKLLIEIISEIKQLQSLYGVLKQIREDKVSGYMEIILLQNLQGAYVLDQKGPKGYMNFVSNLVS